MRYHHAVRLGRMIAVILYATYLVHIGLLFTLVPWSPLWNQFLAFLRPPWSLWLATPGIRGVVSAVGCLHLLLAAAEAAGIRPEQH